MKTNKYFGTDGIRGKAGIYPISVDFILKLGWAAGKILKKTHDERVLIGKDTRLSGYMFESALMAGLSAAGMDVYLLGPLPTPGVAYLTRTFRAAAGIVISASHNPFDDNGIKFFSSEGCKLDNEIELEIEKMIDQPLISSDAAKIGKAYRLEDAAGRYIEYCKSSVPHNTNFKGFKLIIDCANGATYSIAPKVFSELEADITEINTSPNGININDNCGSLHPETLQSHVLNEKADVGIAFDGDGDRVIMVDHRGEIVDGDQLLFIIANYRLKRNKLKGGVVGTKMSNLGLEQALKEKGIPFVRTDVGDHHVFRELKARNWFLGGEPSGHIMCLNKAEAADGIISALQILRIMKDEGKSLYDLKSGMFKYPQVLINVSCDDAMILEEENIRKAYRDGELKLDGKGRILLRSSGTEPVARIMVEGEDRVLVNEIAHNISEEIKKAVESSYRRKAS
jgi:phosphoglucosamine mutase